MIHQARTIDKSSLFVYDLELSTENGFRLQGKVL